MSRVMKCYWNIDNASLAITPLDPPRAYADSRMASIDDRRYQHPELWLWDRWDREAWDEIEEEYGIMKEEWKKLREGMDMAYDGLDASIGGLKEGRMEEGASFGVT
jgi:hypothetical protein